MKVRYLIPLVVVGLIWSEVKPRNGPYEEYHENGQLMLKGSYFNDKREGQWEWYYENGQLWSKASYSNRRLDGPFEFYYEDGQLESKGSFSDGDKCGEWIEEGETLTYPPCPNG